MRTACAKGWWHRRRGLLQEPQNGIKSTGGEEMAEKLSEWVELYCEKLFIKYPPPVLVRISCSA